MSCETLLIGAYNTLFGSTGSVGYYAALDLFCVRVSERGGPKRWTQEAERKSKIHFFNPGRGHTLGVSKNKQFERGAGMKQTEKMVQKVTLKDINGNIRKQKNKQKRTGKK